MTLNSRLKRLKLHAQWSEVDVHRVHPAVGYRFVSFGCFKGSESSNGTCHEALSVASYYMAPRDRDKP